ncbi:MAG: gamma-glutamyltranspeptidase / glutathione hydrolase [Solirubrobacteraceae bacterium]|nr:gamma-glutamyltranspeptidase / glutathione hydrolase [Solirubrobacteraceae bacterium]
MIGSENGVVAAGHPLTARVGADVLREGGNAVDAAVAAMLAAFVAEPLLTGLGSGGYMLVAGAGREPVLLDFFVEAPGRETGQEPVTSMGPYEVDFGDAVQIFHVGPASCGAYGAPAGVCAANDRYGTRPLEELVAPAARLAREGVALSFEQAYVLKILEGLLTSTPEGKALWMPEDRPLVEGDVICNPDLAGSLERLGREGAEPFYRGDIAAAVADWITAHGGTLGRADLAAYQAIVREPVRVSYRGREVLTNPPPSAGGALLAYSLSLLDRAPSPPSPLQLVEAMASAQAERTPEFVEGLIEDGFLYRFLAARLGSTTHISVLDREGLACSVTTTTGQGSAMVVPGTGIHVNNIMGEADLNPLGFHRHPPGRRMPSMMAPTVVLDGDRVELVLGSAGSNRIRSALLQTIVGVLDHDLPADEAVRAPRMHYEDGRVYVEPGIDGAALEEAGHAVTRFRAPNLFFGGVQAVQRRGRAIVGTGDPRRGGVAVGG